MQTVELRHLRYFVAVFDQRNFTRAAGTLCVTQSTISKGMRELEDSLGTPLFFRHSNRVTPTAGGVELFDYAKPILELHQETLDQLRKIHGRSPGGLRVGCEIGMNRRILAVAERVYCKLFPTSRMETVFAPTDHILASLSVGSIDAAIVTLPSEEPATRIVPLFQERMLVCMRADDVLAASSEVEASQVSGRLSIFRPASTDWKAHQHVLKLIEQEGIDIGIPLFASSVEHQLEMVQAGLGLTLIREYGNVPDGLITRPFARLNWTIDTALLYRPSLRSRSTSIWAMRLERTLKKKLFDVTPPLPK